MENNKDSESYPDRLDVMTDLFFLKNRIKEYALSIGIDKIGFTDAAPLAEHLPRLLQRQQAGCRYAIGEGDPAKRINPLAHMPEAKSVISTAVAYPGCEESWAGPSFRRGQELPPDNLRNRGRFSFIARGTDYHTVVRGKLEKLKEYILSFIPDAKIMVMVDKEEILEKALAVKAGLGWFGRNTLLVTPEYGSWVTLGELVTDIPFPIDYPLPEADCVNCRACIEACPTGALDGDKNLNPDKCLAAVTQSKGLPEHELRAKMGSSLYGCDICQMVCPYNRQGTGIAREEYTGSPENAFPLLAEILEMNNAQFKERFGRTSAAWRGRSVIQRNAAIAAGNIKDIESVPALINILRSDSRPVLRGAAAWALGKIDTPDGIRALEQSLETEKDPDVLEEIRRSLTGAGE